MFLPIAKIIYYDVELNRRMFVTQHHLHYPMDGKDDEVYYCGYVEVLPQDAIYNQSQEEIEENMQLNIASIGGITYGGNLSALGVDQYLAPRSSQEPFFIGFDTAHVLTMDSTFEEVKDACKELAHQISAC